jgi:hypothetical protein
MAPTAKEAKWLFLFCLLRGAPFSFNLRPFNKNIAAKPKNTIIIIAFMRRDVRAAEGARLEIVCALTRTEGSNPSLSARHASPDSTVPPDYQNR